MPVARIVRLSFVVIFAMGAAAIARPAAAAVLRFGQADGANAVILLDKDVKQRAIILRTAQAGVAGSLIEVSVDRVKKPVFRHVLGPGECRFGDKGSVCEVIIPARDAAYRAILTRFRHGRRARVTVQDAGTMKMDQTAPLAGFAKTLH